MAAAGGRGTLRRVECSDGVALCVEEWCPEGAAEATVVLVHGWSGSRRSFDLNVGGECGVGRARGG